MSEPASSAAGGFAVAKAIGGILAIGVVASALGFLVLLPKTAKEAMARILATMAGSALLGPLLVVIAYFKWPAVFAAGTQLALQMGVSPDVASLVGLLMVSAPLLAMAGLPFWWILGAGVLWLEKRRGKDLGELLKDAANDGRAVLP
jgi:hypothetical protein